MINKASKYWIKKVNDNECYCWMDGEYIKDSEVYVNTVTGSHMCEQHAIKFNIVVVVIT